MREVPIIRKAIAPLGRKWRQEGYLYPNPDPLKRKYKPGSQEAKDVWAANKPERNAIIGILSDRVVDRALDLKKKYPPFGLSSGYIFQDFSRRNIKTVAISHINPVNPYFTITQGMQMVLHEAVAKEVQDLELLCKYDTSPNPIKSVYLRYKDIIHFGMRYLRQSRVPLTETQLLNNGVNTATLIMGSVMRLIPDVFLKTYGQNPRPEEALQLFANSYSLVVDLAASHLNTLSRKTDFLGQPIQDALHEYIMDPAKFTIDTRAHNPHVILTPEAQEGLNKLNTVAEGSNPIVTGCPALINFNKGSAIKKLWDWAIDLAEAAYTTPKVLS